MKTLVIDIGGTNVKIWQNSHDDPIKVPSGKDLTPQQLLDEMSVALQEVEYDVMSIGYPGKVTDGRPAREPYNLGDGWLEFDYAAHFPRPVRWMNDAAMQALGSYRGGRLLFIGLGTSVGSALIAERLVIPLELGNLFHPFGDTFEDHLAKQALEDDGAKKWRKAAEEVLVRVRDGFMADDVVLGGGNAKKLKLELPPQVRLGHNRYAYWGGCRLWQSEAKRDSHLYLGEDLSASEDGPREDSQPSERQPAA